MADSPSRLTRWLERAPRSLFVAYAMGVGFCTYFCMYAFRKPFAAARFEGQTFLGTEIALKTAFVISQILGYTLSKYLGIRILAEMPRGRRALWLVGLILVAEAALLLFAILPPDAKILAIFLNGIPLGMVWGLVVSYLEGRRTSELLLAGLSCSFIVASGVVKDVGLALMDRVGLDEAWMPFVTGLVFLPAFLLSVWLLNQLPQPDPGDVTARVAREPMDRAARTRFVRRFLPGLLMLLGAYFFLTAFRDFRDNYGVEIFRGLGLTGAPAIFTRTEIPVAIGVMVALAGLNLIKDNRRGLLGAFLVMTAGMVLLGGGTLLLDAGAIDGVTWMIVTGLGSYLAYVPFNSMLFDRMIAYTKVAGTAVFAIYLADAVGYTGSVGIQLYKDLGDSHETRFGFFHGYTYFVSVAGALLLTGALLFFLGRARPRPAPGGGGVEVEVGTPSGTDGPPLVRRG